MRVSVREKTCVTIIVVVQGLEREANSVGELVRMRASDSVCFTIYGTPHNTLIRKRLPEFD